MNVKADSKSLTNRLRRIEGQVRGIQRMVNEDAYCIDIITQISAVRTALDQVGVALLDEHVRSCVAEGLKAGGEQAQVRTDELIEAIGRFARLR